MCAEFQDDAVIPDEVRRFLSSSHERLGQAATLASTVVGDVPISFEPDATLLSMLRQQIRAEEELYL